MKKEVKEIIQNLEQARAEIDSMCYYLIMAKLGNSILFDDVRELRERVAYLQESVYGKDDVDEKDGYQFEEVLFSIELISAKVNRETGGGSASQEAL